MNIFQCFLWFSNFPFVLCSCKSTNKPYLQQRLIKNLPAHLFSFSPAYPYNITHHWSFVSYNLSAYLYFYKMKTHKISCRKVKISISPWDENFHFSARGERYVYLKKIQPGMKFHLGMNFTLPTCNMPLS